MTTNETMVARKIATRAGDLKPELVQVMDVNGWNRFSKLVDVTTR